MLFVDAICQQYFILILRKNQHFLSQIQSFLFSFLQSNQNYAMQHESPRKFFLEVIHSSKNHCGPLRKNTHSEQAQKKITQPRPAKKHQELVHMPHQFIYNIATLEQLLYTFYTLFLCSHMKCTALLPVQTKKINIRSEKRTKVTHRNI